MFGFPHGRTPGASGMIEPVSAEAERGREDWLALAAAGVTVVLWASAFVGIRAAGREFAPGPLALGRLVVAALLLGGLALVRREPLPRGRDVPLLIVCGVLWFALYNVALNAGERRIDAGTAAMLVNVGPILIAILAGLLLREGFPRMLFLGCAIAFVGVGVIGVATSRHGVASKGGVVLCLLAAVAYASGVVAQKVVLRRVSATQTVFWCAVVGVVACLPFSAGSSRRRGTRADQPSPGRSTSAPARARSASRPGPMPSRGRARAAGRDDLPRAAGVGAARVGDPRRDAARARARRRAPLSPRRGGRAAADAQVPGSIRVVTATRFQALIATIVQISCASSASSNCSAAAS